MTGPRWLPGVEGALSGLLLLDSAGLRRPHNPPTGTALVAGRDGSLTLKAARDAADRRCWVAGVVGASDLGVAGGGAALGAESVGEDRCGCLLDHLAPGGAACHTGGESDLFQHVRGAEHVEWLAGLQAGQQPPLVGVRGLVPVLVDLREMVMDDRGDLWWQVEGVAAEPQAGLAGGDCHAVPVQADDPRERLAEHQDQQADQSRCGRQFVGEQPVDLVEPFALAHDRPVVVLEPRWIDAGEVLFSCPAEEPGGVVAGAGSAGVPGVHVGLGGGLQLLTAAGQPVEQVDRDGGGLLGVEERAGGDGFIARSRSCRSRCQWANASRWRRAL